MCSCMMRWRRFERIRKGEEKQTTNKKKENIRKYKIQERMRKKNVACRIFLRIEFRSAFFPSEKIRKKAKSKSIK